MLQIASHCHYLDKPCGFFFDGAPNPEFCVPSQLVSWSAQPLEPPSETYVYRAVKWKTNFLILDKSSEGSDIDLPMLSNAEQCADMSLFIQPVVGRGMGHALIVIDVANCILRGT